MSPCGLFPIIRENKWKWANQAILGKGCSIVFQLCESANFLTYISSFWISLSDNMGLLFVVGPRLGESIETNMGHKVFVEVLTGHVPVGKSPVRYERRMKKSPSAT